LRYQHRYWWQVILLVLWVAALSLFAYWIEGFEPKQTAEAPEPRPDELSAQPDDIGLWYLAKDIFINGIHLHNFELEHPLYILEGDSNQLFFALDETWRNVLGFDIDIIRVEQTILMHDGDSTDPSVLRTGRLTNNLVDSAASVKRGYRIILTDNIPAEAGMTEEERKEEEKEADRIALWLDTFPWLEKLPYNLAERLGYSRRSIEREVLHSSVAFLQQADGTVYLPFDWFTESDEFGWSVWTDGISGVYISTDPEIEAERYYSEANAAFIQALASYMRANNRALGYAESLYFVYLFRHEGWVNGVDPVFLMAIARNESQFRKSVVGGGAIGIMQIMPKTGARFGYSVAALYNPHMNIQFGASYIARFLRNYGSPTIALTAYNAGPGRVASGEYSTAYAEHMLGHQQTILGWLRSRGCYTAYDNGPLVPAEETAETGE
jgi:hypothetical protein